MWFPMRRKQEERYEIRAKMPGTTQYVPCRIMKRHGDGWLTVETFMGRVVNVLPHELQYRKM